MAKEVTRPLSVTLIYIWSLFAAISSVAGGIFLILDRHDLQLMVETYHTSNQLLWAGIVSIVVGIIYFLVASAISQGNNVVRMLIAIVASLNIALGAWSALALHSEQRVAGIFTVIFGVLALYMLFNHKAEAFFEANS